MTCVSVAFVLGVDALTYLVLAMLVACARGGFGFLRSRAELLGLLALTWIFNLLYGSVEVACCSR